MNKKGFTLIELLAVIVILAIIAVIAAPIVLNIIDESKENSNKRSVDMYAKAVENAVASYKLNGNSLSGTFITTDGKTVVSATDENIKFNVEYTGSKVVCETFEIYDNGKFYLSDCKVDGTPVVDYSKGEQQKVKLADTCAEDSEQLYTTNSTDPGYKYNCKVDPSKTEYSFYVLSYNDENGNIIYDKTNAKSINLIMDTTLFYSEWYLGDNYNSSGPLTAMNNLKEATKDWINLDFIIVDKFTDYLNNEYSFGPITSYSRMPYFSELEWLGTISWLDDYYWVLSVNDDGYSACYVETGVRLKCNDPFYIEKGIRPVITLDL